MRTIRKRGMLPVTLAILVALLAYPLTPTRVHADDETFRKAVTAAEEGRYEDAERLLTEVLKANPSSEEALSYRDEAGYKWFVEIMARGGKLATLARRLLKRAEVAALKDRQDVDKMREDINTMLTTDRYVQQYTLVEQLVAKHGHYTVPLLVEVLGDERELEKRVRAIAFLKRLGDEGILAVLELLESENALLQRNAAIVLGYIKDRRAIPALKRKAESAEDQYVKEEAGKSLAKMQYAGSTGDAYVVLAEAYYKEHPLVMVNGYKEWVVWKWRNKRLTKDIVPQYSWNERISEELCFDGLAANKEDRRLWATLVNVYAMQWNEVTESLRVSRQVADRGGEVDDEFVSTLEQEKTRLKKALALIASSGKQALFDGLAKAQRDNNAAAAQTIIEQIRDININGTTLPGPGSVKIDPVYNIGGLPGLAEAQKQAEIKSKPAPKPAPQPQPNVAPTPAPKPAPAPEAPPAQPEEPAKPKPRRRPRVSQLPGKRQRGYAVTPGVFPQVPGPQPQVKPAAPKGGVDGSALCAALVFGDKRVRFSAAMALAKLNPGQPFANVEKVVENLSEAISQNGQRVVLVVEPDNNTRNELVGQLRELGYMVTGITSGNEALIRAKRFPAQDLIIVSSELNKDGSGDEPLEFQFVRNLKSDYRTAPMKVMVLTPPAREVEMRQLVDSEDNVVDLIVPGIDKIKLRDKIKAIFEDEASQRDEKARADAISAEAALAVASLTNRRTLLKLDGVVDALVKNLELRTDPVRIAAMKGLSAVGPIARQKALPTLLKVFRAKDENSEEVRVACANAIGDVINGSPIQGDAFKTLKAAFAEDSTQIWKAAAYALGKANLTGAQRFEVYTEQRLADASTEE